MRKFVLFFISLLLCVSSVNAQVRNEFEAQSVAEEFFSKTQTSLSKGRFNTTNDIFHLVKAGNQNAYYIFGNEGDKGFVIVSGDKRMEPILGFSNTSTFNDSNEIPENVKYWLGLYEKEYQLLQEGKIQSVPTHRESSYSGTAVDPIVTAEWGQDSPFNNNCPTYNGSRCLTGCVATAMSQIMHSFKYPSCGNGNFSYNTTTRNISVSEDLSNHPFDWDNMIDDYSSGSSTKQNNAVANLCYMTGVSVEMDYDTTSSGSYETNAMLAFVNNFSYDSDIAMYFSEYMNSDEWHNLLQTELQNGHPILYSASTPQNEGHAFILDGYTPPASSSGTPYYHINWGWNGYCNGDFAISSLVASGYSFSETHHIIGGIEPENNQVDINSLWEGSGSLSTTKMKESDLQSVSADFLLYNFASKTFSGSLNFKLVTPNGTKKTLKTIALSGISAFSGSNFNLDFTPEDGVGIYKIEVYTKASGKTSEDKAYVSGDISLEVLSADQDLPEKDTNLQVTSMTINESACTSTTINVTLSDIINMADDSFTGTINLAVVNTDGTINTVMDTGTEISDLGHFRRLTYPRTFDSTIPSGIQDGQYRLYAVSCQSGYSGWSFVRQWTLEGNYITSMDKELYRDIWIKDGDLYMTDPGKDGSNVNVTVQVNGNGKVLINDTDEISSGTTTVGVLYGTAPKLTFVPDAGMQLSSVTIDGTQEITSIGDLTYTLPTLKEDVNIVVKYVTAIDFQNAVEFTYDANSSSVTKTSSGGYAKGSKLVCKLNNTSAETLTEIAIYIADGENGEKSNNLLGTSTYTLDSGYIRSWTITLGSNYNNPVIFETYRVRGEEYTKYCGPNVQPAVIVATGITLDKTAISLEAEETATIKATVTPSNVTDNTVTWSSSDTSIATVKDGVVTAVKVGTATITATTADGSNLSATCTVTVVPTLVQSITLDKHSAEISLESTITLTATVSPDNATNKDVVWSSSDENVATVKDGVVNAISVGTATITATTEDGSNLSATCEINVLPIVAESLTISQTSAELNIGDEIDLSATITPSNATYKDLIWNSSDESVASVDNGHVVALAEGEADISVRTNDGSNLISYCHVKVNPILVKEIVFSEKTYSIHQGETLALEYTVNPENATNPALEWETNDETVATVSEGIVSALQQGIAIITAKATDGSGVSGMCAVAVTEPSGIFNVKVYNNIEGIFTLDGKKIEKMHQGVFVVRMKDGTTKKVTIK